MLCAPAQGSHVCVFVCVPQHTVCVHAHVPSPSRMALWLLMCACVCVWYLQDQTELRLLEFGCRELETQAEKLFAMTSLTIPNASRDFVALKRWVVTPATGFAHARGCHGCACCGLRARCVCMCMHVCACMCMCMHLCAFVCIGVHVCACVC